MSTDRKINTIKGWSPRRLHEFLNFEFRDQVFSVNINQKTVSFLVFIDKNTKEDRRNAYKTYFKEDLDGIQVDFLLCDTSRT